MAAEERAIVKTTVPSYQKDAWTDHASALDMSQSEFIRSMVQAGRRRIELEPADPPSPDPNPRGNALEERVLALLDERDPVHFDEIVEAVTAGIESRVDEILQSLGDQDRVRFSNVDGYTLVEGAHGDD